MGYELMGGYNYSGPIETDATTLNDAAEQWHERYRYGRSYYGSDPFHKVDGISWPCFGDMEDDSYAVVNFDTDEAMTRAEVLAMMGDEG